MRHLISLIDLSQLSPAPFWVLGVGGIFLASPLGSTAPVHGDHRLIGAQVWALACAAGLLTTVLLGLSNALIGVVVGDTPRWTWLSLLLPPLGTARWFAVTRRRFSRLLRAAPTARPTSPGSAVRASTPPPAATKALPTPGAGARRVRQVATVRLAEGTCSLVMPARSPLPEEATEVDLRANELTQRLDGLSVRGLREPLPAVLMASFPTSLGGARA